MDALTAERSQRDIIRFSHAGLDSRALRLAVLGRLRKVIPIDAFWCATVDPATLLFTGSLIEGIPEAVTPAFVANEFLHNDANKFARLATGDPAVRSLHDATGGDLSTSARYREILAPLGWGDELRAALITGGACWGVMCLHREGGTRTYTAAEAAFLAHLTPHIAEGLRAALLLDNADTIRETDGPGLLVLADDFSIVATTPTAERWLAEMGDWPRRAEVPQAVRAVAARLWALERGEDTPEALMPRVRIRTRAGDWVVLHASRLSGAGGGTADGSHPRAGAAVGGCAVDSPSLRPDGAGGEGGRTRAAWDGHGRDRVGAHHLGAHGAAAPEGGVRQDGGEQPTRTRRAHLRGAI